MFDIIRKDEYWKALDDPETFQKLGGFTLKALDGLKHIQDAWTLHHLIGTKDSRVLEIGGGVSRVLPALDKSNERWNLDEFMGAGNGVTKFPEMPEVRLLRKTMGSFAQELQKDYFDIVFSISVIEHIPWNSLDAFWEDHARVLSSGGVALHTIDLYLSDEPSTALESRLGMYLDIPAKYGLRTTVEPAISLRPKFECNMASNSDWGMWRWNKNVPVLYETRRNSQSVSLALIMRKN